MSRTANKLMVCMALVVLGLPAVAQASARDVVIDCARDGDLDRKYSNSDLRRAQGQLPTDIDEYSDCREVIAGAITSASDRGKGRDNGDGSGGATGATAAERREREAAARAADLAALDSKAGKRPNVNIGGTDVEPGDNGLFNLASATNGIPTPLLLGLIAAALLAILGGLTVLRRRFPELAQRFPLLSKLTIPRVSLSRLLGR